MKADASLLVTIFILINVSSCKLCPSEELIRLLIHES